MAEHIVLFDVASEPVSVPTGSLISEAAEKAGVEINQPCGGQGRCGRCAVQVTEGDVRRRSTLRLSDEDVKSGYALACQSVIEGDVKITVPPQEKIQRRLTTDRTVGKVSIPDGYDPQQGQTVRRINVTLSPPSMDDQSDDWSRLQTALRKQSGVTQLRASLECMRKIGPILRKGDWKATAILNGQTWDCPDCPAELLSLQSGHLPETTPLWGAAVDIGTTTVSVWMVDLLTGEVQTQVAEYNQQISRGEDVISRIIVA
ncbi:MAG: 2Fe-2S iron-sulfur cluster-binding protein, partial [Chloroflexota bacterium]